MYIVHTGIASDPRLNGSEAIPVVMIHCTYTYAVMTYSTTLDRAFVTELTQLDRSEFHQRQRAAVEEEEEEGGRGSNDRGSGGVVEEEGEGGRAEEGESKKHDPPLRSVSQDKVGECNVMYMYMYMLVITLYNVCKYCLFTTCCPPPPPPQLPFLASDSPLRERLMRQYSSGHRRRSDPYTEAISLARRLYMLDGFRRSEVAAKLADM